MTRTRTYLVPKVGIFQRVGEATTLIVYFFSLGKKLRPRLRFVETTKKVAHKWFREEMEREVVTAVARARWRRL